MDDNSIQNVVDDTAHVIDTSLSSCIALPNTVVSVIAENDHTGSWARGSGMFSEIQHGVYAEEGKVSYDERSHASEPF